MTAITEVALKQVAREPLTRAECERAALFAKVLVAAALANKYVRCYVREEADTRHPVWTEEKVRANPPVRVEFEHAIVLGGIGEALAAAKGKCTFGEFVGVLPVEPLDPVGERNVMFLFKDTSPYNRRVEQRRWMKGRLAKLGKGFRELVTYAMEQGKRQFTAFDHGRPRGFEGGPAAARAAIRMAFGPGVDLGRFWRMARGKELIERPKAPVQGELFDSGRDEIDDVEVVLVERKPAAKAPPTLSLGLLNVEKKPRPAPRGLFDDEPAEAA